MRQAIIAEGRIYKLTSYGNGLSFTFAHKPTGKSVFFQGDDATIFNEAWELAERMFPEWTADDIGLCLWCDHEYGSIAEHQPVEPWGPYCRVNTRLTFIPCGKVEPTL